MTSGSGNAAKLQYTVHDRAADGTWKPADGLQTVELAGAVGPRGVKLLPMDVNGDQRLDLLSIAGGAAKAGVQVLQVQDDGSLTAVSQASQLDPGITAPGRSFVRGSQLLAAQATLLADSPLTPAAGRWKTNSTPAKHPPSWRAWRL
ncbi:MAG UNVERIFIED_CONTAM: hypothetical protein LVR18_17060 [Planctomycetaceae bacterium]|jgi:hypothetical protein